MPHTAEITCPICDKESEFEVEYIPVVVECHKCHKKFEVIYDTYGESNEFDVYLTRPITDEESK